MGPMPLLPGASVSVEEADRRAQNLGWAMYVAGCCCLCFFTPLSPILWLVAAALYYCKNPQQRDQFTRQRSIARISLATCAVAGVLVLIPATVMAIMELSTVSFSDAITGTMGTSILITMAC